MTSEPGDAPKLGTLGKECRPSGCAAILFFL